MLPAPGVWGELPPCAQGVVLQGLAMINCGEDAACACELPGFAITVSAAIPKICGVAESTTASTAFSELCGSAVPSLHDNRGSQVVGVASAMIALSTIMVALRCVSRKLSGAKFGVDDAFILIALLFTYGNNILFILLAKYGAGRHWIMIPGDQSFSFLKGSFAGEVLIGPCITAVKLSILFLYRRIFATRQFRIVSLAVIILTVAWFIAHIFAHFFQCTPFGYFWDRTIPGGKCVNHTKLINGLGGANIIGDIIILLLPIPYLWKLQMRAERKVAISFVFLLGGFTCVAAIIRIPMLHRIDVFDVTYSSVEPIVWSASECSIGLVCACLPAMRPIFHATIPENLRSYFSLSRSRSRSGGHGLHKTGSDEKHESSSSKVETFRSRAEAAASRGPPQQSQVDRKKKHESWYTAAATRPSVGKSRVTDSMEEMMPWEKDDGIADLEHGVERRL
ncbi:MAG: hypothetical protein Q9164_001454 [Protoblastenia rupestris]